jgi:glutamate racemase
MIGIFDSGVGGLTVVKQIFKVLPRYKVVYFGDTARVPYGTKGEKVVKKYSVQNTDFLLRKGAKIIVVACHTASSVAGDYLRKEFPSIPIFDVVGSGLDRALKVTKNEKIGIIGTESTVRSKAHKRYIKQINPKVAVVYQACPLFVPLVEERWLNRPETKKIARYYLRFLKQKRVDTVVLACTHYPLLSKVILKVMGKNVSIVDPAYETALEIKNYLKNHPEFNKLLGRNGRKYQFFASDVPSKFKEIGGRVLGKAVYVEQVELD